MALSFRGGDADAPQQGNDASLSMPAGIAEDDVAYVFGGFNSSFSSADPGVSTAGYTELVQFNDTGGDDFYASVSRKVMGATPDSSATGIGSNDFNVSSAYALHVWTGADTTTPEDATTTTATGTGDNPDPPSITTNTDGAVVLACGGVVSRDGAVTAPSGYDNLHHDAILGSREAGAAIASKEITTAGAEDPGAYSDWTSQHASFGWSAATIAIAPAAGGATVLGAAALAGAGDLAGAAFVQQQAEAALAGSGDITGAATLTIRATAALAGSGDLTGTPAAGGATVLGAATLDGLGDLTGAARLDISAAATLAGAGDLTGAADLLISAAATLAGTGDLAGAAFVRQQAAAALAGAGDLAGAAFVQQQAEAALAGSGDITGAATLTIRATAALAGSGDLTGTPAGSAPPPAPAVYNLIIRRRRGR